MFEFNLRQNTVTSAEQETERGIRRISLSTMFSSLTMRLKNLETILELLLLWGLETKESLSLRRFIRTDRSLSSKQQSRCRTRHRRGDRWCDSHVGGSRRRRAIGRRCGCSARQNLMRNWTATKDQAAVEGHSADESTELRMKNCWLSYFERNSEGSLGGGYGDSRTRWRLCVRGGREEQGKKKALDRWGFTLVVMGPQ